MPSFEKKKKSYFFSMGVFYTLIRGWNQKKCPQTFQILPFKSSAIILPTKILQELTFSCHWKMLMSNLCHSEFWFFENSLPNISYSPYQFPASTSHLIIPTWVHHLHCCSIPVSSLDCCLLFLELWELGVAKVKHHVCNDELHFWWTSVKIPVQSSCISQSICRVQCRLYPDSFKPL